MMNSQNNINFSGRYQSIKQVAGGAKHFVPKKPEESCFFGDNLMINVLRKKHAHDDIKFSLEGEDSDAKFVVELSKDVYKKAFGGKKGQKLRAKLESNQLKMNSSEDFEKVAKNMFASDDVKGLRFEYSRSDFLEHFLSASKENYKNAKAMMGDVGKNPFLKIILNASLKYHQLKHMNFLNKVESFMRETLPNQQKKLDDFFKPDTGSEFEDHIIKKALQK